MNDLLNKITLQSLISTVIVVIFVLILLYLINKINKKYLTRLDNESQMAKLFKYGFKLLRILVIACCIFIIFEINGINVTSLITGLGLVSAAIGLALQDILKDAVMGFHILSDHFFNVGDVVKYKDNLGIVEHFNMKSTKIKLLADNSILNICNRNIDEIIKMPDILTIYIILPLEYEEDFNKIDKVLTIASSKIEQLDKVSSAQYLGTDSFEDSAINYRLSFSCPIKEMYILKRQALRIIQEVLKENNINIPYNKIDIHNY